MKRCKKCGVERPFADFYANTGGRDGRRPECKACTAAARRAWYQANREKAIKRVVAWQRANKEKYRAKQRAYRKARPLLDREQHLRSTFGLSLAEYDALLRAQGGGCAICESLPNDRISLHIDHDHESGEIRGLLCFRCNGGLGQFKEDSELLLRAVEYLAGGARTLIEATELAALARGRASVLKAAKAS